MPPGPTPGPLPAPAPLPTPVPRPLAVLATSDEVLAHPAADERLLDPGERDRADRFRRESDRRDFVAAHLLVRLCAARLLGIDPAEVAFAQHCPGCGLPGHGRPLLRDRPDVGLSLSHTEGMVAAAAGTVPVGVDVELRGREAADPAVRKLVLAAAEAALVAARPEPDEAFLRLWVRKEALVKLGRAELDGLGGIDLSALPLDLPGPGPAVHRHQDLHLLDWTDHRRGALIAVASPLPAVLGTAAVPLSDLPT